MTSRLKYTHSTHLRSLGFVSITIE